MRNALQRETLVAGDDISRPAGFGDLADRGDDIGSSGWGLGAGRRSLGLACPGWMRVVVAVVGAH